MARHEIDVLVREAEGHGELLGIRLPVTDEEDSKPWTAPASGWRKDPPVTGPLPEQLHLVLGNQIYIPKEGLGPSLRNRFIRLAAFQNPEFYRAEAMRLSTYGKPRIISCCEEFPKHLALPRGCLDQALELLASLQVRAEVTDERFAGTPIDVQFHGTLRPEQLRAAEALLRYDTGVLAASTAFGKTVIGAYLIAQRKVNTLVIVHRRQLLDQWIRALSNFLGLESDSLGQIGGGKHKPTARLDVAMIQSLSDKGTVSEIVGEYGQLIVDECHHISAVSFERVVRQSKARYVTGLSATVVRRDGHHPVIFMQCGPLRFRVADRKHAGSRPFRHRVIVRLTGFHVPEGLKGMTSHHIHELYSMLVVDEDRNRMIVEDVVAAIQARRSPLLLTERRDHLETLVGMLAPLVENVIVMTGGMRKRQRDSLAEKLASVSPSQERVIVATGRYLGEGFDDSRLDTLFLALPISWRGTLTQYAGRLHRLHADKQDVIVFDYVDSEVRVLAGMYARRRKGYKTIGYEIDLPGEGGQTSSVCVGESLTKALQNPDSLSDGERRQLAWLLPPSGMRLELDIASLQCGNAAVYNLVCHVQERDAGRLGGDRPGKPPEGPAVPADGVVGAAPALHVGELVVDECSQFRVAHGPLRESLASHGSASLASVHCLVLPAVAWRRLG